MAKIRLQGGLWAALATVGLLGVAGTATAQAPAGRTYVGPYANPYTQAGLPPYLLMAPNDPQAGMLTLLYLNRKGGGIGSGRLSDGSAFRDPTRPAPAGVRPPAHMPRSLATPTAGAERYFGRVPDRGAPAADYFNRSGTSYFNRSSPSYRR